MPFIVITKRPAPPLPFGVGTIVEHLVTGQCGAVVKRDASTPLVRWDRKIDAVPVEMAELRVVLRCQADVKKMARLGPMGYPLRRRGDPDPSVVSRFAVATLEEAQRAAWGPTDSEWTWDRVCRVVSSSGGSVGPLPDGTVIEVEPITWARLRREVPGYWPDLSEARTHLLAAYNAKQAQP